MSILRIHPHLPQKVLYKYLNIALNLYNYSNFRFLDAENNIFYIFLK